MKCLAKRKRIVQAHLLKLRVVVRRKIGERRRRTSFFAILPTMVGEPLVRNQRPQPRAEWSFPGVTFDLRRTFVGMADEEPKAKRLFDLGGSAVRISRAAFYFRKEFLNDR